MESSHKVPMVPPAVGALSEGDFQAERQAMEERKFWA